jgi:Protein of unknown function (DUF3592)
MSARESGRHYERHRISTAEEVQYRPHLLPPVGSYGGAPAVAAAQAFGGWPTVPEDGSAPRPTVTVRQAPRPNLIAVQVFLAVFAMIGLAIAGVEAYRIMMWQPIAATVMGSDVLTVHGNKGGVSYRPEVSYRYRINGQEVIGAGVTPIKIAAGWGWAQSIRARFRPGAAVTVYVDPGDPTRAYAVREFSPIPLYLTGGAAVLWVLIMWTARSNDRRRATGDLGVPVVGVGGPMSPLP